ncbi:hypothetical protein [Pseudoduganella namucuonensis]|uniref:Uncharacterized protein n=1 Tax=Pseudoduganella namucuonensis TaxID=1035707 RepID=A0A1I7LVY7_9BURK|nr:hypothetical protein [Pseudoduganella namucuonensis]SFV13845.1 hypothetical protein SAMN05216552_104023 [Pseudoduganella namucuonensis]
MSTITAASDRSTQRSIKQQKAIGEVTDAMDDTAIFLKLMKKAEEAAQAAA